MLANRKNKQEQDEYKPIEVEVDQSFRSDNKVTPLVNKTKDD